MNHRRQARIAAFQALYMVEMGRTDLWVNDPEWEWLEEDNPLRSSVELRELAQRLFRGTLDHLGEIDEQIRTHSKRWQLDRIGRVDLSILRLGVYELLFARPPLPPAVVIDEAVEIAKEFGGNVSYKFINGVIDAIRRSRQVPS